MSEYYEPQINISSPETHNTMGVIVVLKEKVDGEILRQVVEELRERFPYFYVKVGRRGGGQTTEENRAGVQPIEAGKCSQPTNPADLINHSFFIALMQPFSSEEYYNCFLKELDEAGIHDEELSSEPLRICGI